MQNELDKQNNLSKLSDNELDDLLMTKVNERWQKVARIMASVLGVVNIQYEERVHARIKALVAAKRIENMGNVENPRFSEIRLPVKEDVIV